VGIYRKSDTDDIMLSQDRVTKYLSGLSQNFPFTEISGLHNSEWQDGQVSYCQAARLCQVDITKWMRVSSLAMSDRTSRRQKWRRLGLEPSVSPIAALKQAEASPKFPRRVHVNPYTSSAFRPSVQKQNAWIFPVYKRDDPTTLRCMYESLPLRHRGFSDKSY
jgi:hypothetical protein